jgi:solute carrier family 25 carnitine/acylcarnitine transporter 20/29
MEKNNFIHEFIAGNVGGLCGIFAVYPLDTAKIRMQVYPHYKSTLDVIRQMSAADGYKSLYRGSPAPIAGFGLTFAISFSSYGICCRELARRKNIELNQLDYFDLSLAGTVTGFVQSPTRQIMERFKSIMQVHENSLGKVSYKWTGSCFLELIRKEGLRNGLFQGFGSVLLREVPQFAVYYPCYEMMKLYLTNHINNIIVVQLLSGGLAGVVQWLPPIYCFDVIKSKMQTAPKGTYSGIADCAREIYRTNGIKGFFRGFTPAMFRAFPLHAIVFCGYETTLSMLQKHNQIR